MHTETNRGPSPSIEKHSAEVFVVRDYTAKMISSERDAWVYDRGKACERDETFLSQARKAWESPDVQVHREEHARAAPEYVREFVHQQGEVAKQTLGENFGAACRLAACGGDEAARDVRDRLGAYSSEMGRRYPMTAPTTASLLANSAQPQITYFILAGDKALVFTGKAAVQVDNGMGLDPHSINRDSNIPPLMTLPDGLRVNFDLRGFSPEFTSYVLNRINTSIFPGLGLKV